MRRKSVIEHPFYEVEQCPAGNVRIYRVHGLRLYDARDERNHGPVIDLLRSMPGVAHACFKNCHTFVVKRSRRMTWQDAEPQIVNLLQGVAAYSDGFSARKEVNSDFTTEQYAAVAVAILRSAERRCYEESSLTLGNRRSQLGR
jgi:hypothetical protein